MEYRREIDGLRALAVIPVVLFHAGFTAFGGGYTGVDVFFVISGYLITLLILTEMRAGTFTLAGFYERRARRILPALFLVMLACVPFAWVLMLPDDLENFGQSLVATTFFGNNVLLWITSGYWGLANEFKPLLHTWSLGVEEQFYLGFPLLLLLVAGWGKRWLGAVLLLLAACSLAAAQWLVMRQPDAAFFLLPTRGWELMVGALCAAHVFKRVPLVREPRRSDQWLALAGLLLIVGAAFALRDVPYPGVSALAPTLGTALVLLCAGRSTMVGRLLASRVLAGMGLLSYGIYLWHQPVLAFIRVASLEEPTPLALGAGLLLAVALAGLSWRFVEQPFRNRTTVGSSAFLRIMAAAGLLLAGVGGALYVQYRDAGGASARYNERPRQFLNQPFSDGPSRKVLVVGNSFARDFLNAAHENGYLSSSEISYVEANIACIADARLAATALPQLLARAQYLVVSAESVDAACWPRDLAALRKLGGAKVIVLGAKDFGWNLNAAARLDPQQRVGWRAMPRKEVVDANRKMSASLDAKSFVDVLALLSDGRGSVRVFTDEGKVISPDRRHLTPEGARYLGRILFEHPLLRDLK